MTTQREHGPTSTTAAPAGADPAAGSPPLWARALLAAGLVAAVNVGVLGVGRAAGASLTMAVPDPVTVTWPAVVVASVLPIALGGLVAWLLARRWPRARVVLAWSGLAVAVLSCLALLGAPDATTAATLATMHVGVGVAWFLALTWRGRRL